MRGARIAYLATLAVEHGLVLRVRRGRHGAGLSLPETRARLAKRLRGGFFRGTKDDARALAAFHAGCDSDDVRVTTDAREPGTVRVWLPSGTPIGAVARAQRSLEDHMPADVLFIVDRATASAAPPEAEAAASAPW